MMIGLGLSLPGIATLNAGGGISRLALVVAGQSLGEYPFTRGTVRVARYWAEYLRTLGGFTVSRNVAGYNSSRLYHDGSSQTAEDWTVRLDNCASGGSQLLSNTHIAPTGQNSHVNESNNFGGTGNYWWNAPGTDQSAITGNALDNNSAGTTWTKGPLQRNLESVIAANVAAGRPVNGLVWSQGTSDMGTDPTYLANYEAQFAATIAGARDAAGNPNLPVFIHLLGTQYVSTDAGAEAIRQAQRNVEAGDQYVYISGEEYPYRRATTRVVTGLTFTSGATTVTVPDGTLWDQNGEVMADELPKGTVALSISGNVITLGRRVMGATVSSAFTASNASGTLKKVDNVHLYPGSDGTEPLDGSGGTIHDYTQGFYALVKASSEFVANKLSMKNAPASAQGPYASSASVTRGSNVIRVGITHVSGSDFTEQTDTQGWRVLVDGSLKTITGVAKVNATAVDITVSGVITTSNSTLSVQYGYGANTRTGTDRWIFDNAGYPMQASNAVTGVINASSEVITLGNAANGVNSASASSYTFSSLAIGEAPSGRRHVLVGIVAVASSTTRTISSVTVGGVAATLVTGTFKSQANAAATGASYSAFYMAEVPTGTTADVVVAFNSSMSRIGVVAWPLYTAATSPSVFDTESSGSQTSTDTLAVALDTYLNGAAFGVSVQAGGSAVRLGGASSAPTSTGTGAPISAAPASGDITWSGLTEGVDAVIATTTASSSLMNTVALAPF